MDQVNTIFLKDNDNIIGFNDASGIEEGEVTFILPADNYYSVFFELDTDCGVIKKVSSSYFSKHNIIQECAGMIFYHCTDISQFRLNACTHW